MFVLLFLATHKHTLCVDFFHSFAMVAGLKSGSRVQALATKVFGQSKAKNLFPTSFKTELVCGKVLRKGQGRKMVVIWDDIGETTSTSSRVLQNEDPIESAAPTSEAVVAVVAVGADEAVAASESASKVVEDAVSDSDEEIPINSAYDPSEVVSAADPGDDLLSAQLSVEKGVSRDHHRRCRPCQDGYTG